MIKVFYNIKYSHHQCNHRFNPGPEILAHSLDICLWYFSPLLGDGSLEGQCYDNNNHRPCSQCTPTMRNQVGSNLAKKLKQPGFHSLYQLAGSTILNK